MSRSFDTTFLRFFSIDSSKIHLKEFSISSVVSSNAKLCTVAIYGNLKPVDHWLSAGGPQHASRVGHTRLCTLKIGLHAK